MDAFSGMINCGYARKKSQPLLAGLRHGSFGPKPENRLPGNAIGDVGLAIAASTSATGKDNNIRMTTGRH
jgi:hypothetical protein